MKIQLDMGPIAVDLQVRLRDEIRERELASELHVRDKHRKKLLGLVTGVTAAAIPLVMKWLRPEEDLVDPPQGSGSAHPHCDAACGCGAGDVAGAHQRDPNKEDGEKA